MPQVSDTINNKEVAYVLVNCESGTEESVIEKLKTIQGIKEVKGVSGNYDVITKIETESLQTLRDIIVFGIRKIQQIRSTTTVVSTTKADPNGAKAMNLTLMVQKR